MPLKESAKKVWEKLPRPADILSVLLSDNCYKKVLRAVELLFVLLMSLLVISGLVFLAVGPEPEKTRTGKIIILLSKNWKVMLLLLIPLFYLPIRTFVDELEEAWGAKRKKPPARHPQDNPPRRGKQ